MVVMPTNSNQVFQHPIHPPSHVSSHTPWPLALPSAMTAASLYFQSVLRMCSNTNGTMDGRIVSSQQPDMRDRHTPAALHGFHSSSSSQSSCNHNTQALHHYRTRGIPHRTRGSTCRDAHQLLEYRLGNDRKIQNFCMNVQSSAYTGVYISRGQKDSPAGGNAPSPLLKYQKRGNP